MAEHSNNPDYELIKNLTPEITAASNANSAEVVWVGKYSHSSTCGNWIESVSKYSEIVTWEEIPCSATSGTEIVNYSVDWHGIAITGTINVAVEKCPCDYQVVDEWYTMKEIGPLEESLDPDDTEIHILYTIEHHAKLSGSGCSAKTIVETIHDELIQKVNPIIACEPGDTVITADDEHWIGYGPEIGSKYYPIRPPYPSTLDGDIPRNPRICCQGSSTQECQSISNVIAYLQISLDNERVRYVETTLFPAETRWVYVSYDKTVLTQNCDGEDVLITLHVNKKQIEITPNESTEKQATREIELENGCAIFEVVLDKKDAGPITSLTISYEISDEKYDEIDCIPTQQDTDSIHFISQDKLELKYIYIFSVSAITTTNGTVSTTTYKREKLRHSKSVGDNFTITVGPNDSDNFKYYSLVLTGSNSVHFSDETIVSGIIKNAIVQKPCDNGPGDSSQDCFPKKYLKVNDGSQVFIRERMEATQENEFREVTVDFSKENTDHESIFYPDTHPNSHFVPADDEHNTATYEKIPWEIVEIKDNCDETPITSGTISASQGYSVSTICSNDEYIMYNATQVLSASSDGNNVAWTSGLQPVGDNTLYSEVIFTMEIQLFGECIESDPCNGKTRAICFNGTTATIGQGQPLDGCKKTASVGIPVTVYRLTPTENGCSQSTEPESETVNATIRLNSKTVSCQNDKYTIPFTASTENGEIKTSSDVDGTSATFGPEYTLAEGCNNQTFTVTVYQTCGCDSDCDVSVHITPAMPGITVRFDDANNTTGITNNEGYVVFEGGETTKTMTRPTKATVDAGSTFDGNTPIAINDCDEHTFLAKWGISTAATSCSDDVELALSTKKVTATGGCWTRVTQKGDTVLLRTKSEYNIDLTPSTSTTTVGQSVSFTKSQACSFDAPDSVTIQVDGESSPVTKYAVWKDKEMSVTATPDYVGTDGGTITISHETCVPTMADELYVHVIPENDTISYEGGNMNITYFASYSHDPSDTGSVVDVNDIQLTWDNPDVITGGPASHSGGIYTQPVTFPRNDTENNIDVNFTASTLEAYGEATVILLDIFSLPPSDYLVFTYHWDDGEDLDSLTIINTNRLKTKSTAFTESRILTLDKVGVGYNACASLPVLDDNNNPIDGVYYIQHGGDNRETGNEGAMICWNNIIKSGEFGIDDILTVNIYANWFISRGSGDMRMSVAAYKGNGKPSNQEMKLENFVFEPINGTKKVYPGTEGGGTLNRNIFARGGSNCYYAFESYLAGAPLAYSKVATVKYDIKDKTPQIIPPGDPEGYDKGMIYGEHDITLSTAKLVDGSYKYSGISTVKVYPSGQTVTFDQMCIVSHDGSQTEEYSIFGVSGRENDGQLFIHTPWKEDGTVSQLEGKTYKLDKIQFTSSIVPIIDTDEIKIYGWIEDDGNGKSRECMKFEIEPYSHASDLYIRIIPLSWVKLKDGDRNAIFKHQSPEDLTVPIHKVMVGLTVDIDLLKV